jgi:hypothetical protein
MTRIPDNPGNPAERRQPVSGAEDPAAMAELMELPNLIGKVWHSQELSAILRHQMSAPVQFDLSELPAGLGAKLRSLTAAQGLLIRSFGDLLRHPHPPLELLKLTKRFAKASSHHPDSPLPPEISRVLYYAAIVVAQTRCGERISGLDNAGLKQGLDWALTQLWLDASTRMIFEQGLKALDESKRSGT